VTTGGAELATGAAASPARTARLLRATAAGGASLCLGVAAHVAAGGGPPGLPLVAVAGALLVRLAYGLAGRRRGLPTMLAGLVCSQLALHVAFTLSGHSSVGGAGLHRHELAPAALLLERDGHGLAGPVLMVVAHLVAVVLTALLLHRADTVIWAAGALRATLSRAAAGLVGPFARTAARLRRLLISLTAGRPAPQRPRAGGLLGGCLPPPRPRTVPLGRAARRRGPPRAELGQRPHLAA
jgi:hypothetical protein